MARLINKVYRLNQQRHQAPMKIQEQSPYYLEIQALQELKQTNDLINMFKLQIAQHLFKKQQIIKVEISKDLREKCIASLKINQKTVYKCEYCPRQFNDGRQLGGHVSKAHNKNKEKVLQDLDLNEMKMQPENQPSIKLEEEKNYFLPQ